MCVGCTFPANGLVRDSWSLAGIAISLIWRSQNRPPAPWRPKQGELEAPSGMNGEPMGRHTGRMFCAGCSETTFLESESTTADGLSCR